MNQLMFERTMRARHVELTAEARRARTVREARSSSRTVDGYGHGLAASWLRGVQRALAEVRS